MSDKINTIKMAELESYKNRLENDVRRSRLIDNYGLTRDTPLIRNLERVTKEIKDLKEGK